MTEVWELGATAIAGAVQRKQISPTEVFDTFAERIRTIDAHIHAFCTPNLEEGRNSAVRVEKRILAGDEVGPVAGVPIGIKDLIFTRGLRTMGGSKAYEKFVPDEDDVVVARVREAGVPILGKTAVPEFGYSGTSVNPVSPWTENPWDLGKTPGGSSSGSAAAVAAGLAPWALASDGGGSIRIPASFCGLFGFKPSMGRVPLYPGCRDESYPGFSSWASLEHLGPVTRSVSDAALMLSTIAGPDHRDRYSLPLGETEWLRALEGDIRGRRIAFSLDWGYALVDPEVRAVVQEALTVFERDLGCVVTEEVHPGWADLGDAFWALVAASTDLRGMRRMAEVLGEDMTPHLVDFVRTDWTAEQLTDGEMMRHSVKRRLSNVMRDYDLFLTPTVAVPPFELGPQGPPSIDGRHVDQFDWLPFTAPANMTGQPAATVPAGWTKGGLPIGLQIMGRHLDDELVMAASARFEEARPWASNWPRSIVQLAGTA